MIQDAPVSGTPLSAAFLAGMAREIKNVAYFKIETAAAASTLRELIALGGDAIEGPWDGEEAITLLPDLDAGATGAMTGGGYPDGNRKIMDAYAAGRAKLRSRPTSAGYRSSILRSSGWNPHRESAHDSGWRHCLRSAATSVS